jgi:hypothetical protein
LLDCRPVVGLPELCGGPTFVFLFIEDPKIARFIVAPQCTGGLLDIADDILPRPTRVLLMEVTLFCTTVEKIWIIDTFFSKST